MKLRILAEAAEEFYKTPDLRSRGKHRDVSHPRYENAHRKKARHVCQWIAMNAGCNRSFVARFWEMDRTSIYYGCRAVEKQIATDPEEKQELERFAKVVEERLSK
tara:strand:- start:42 stop:356 length:315 start_codon:yes stop_codon:yes gene_type:complete